MCLPFLFFLYSWNSKFSSGIISFQPSEVFFSHSFRVSLLSKNYLSFVFIWECLYSSSFLKNIFTGCRILGNSSFNMFLSSGLHDFWWEICSHLNGSSPFFVMCWFSLGMSKIFSLTLLFSSLIMMCLGVIT